MLGTGAPAPRTGPRRISWAIAIRPVDTAILANWKPQSVGQILCEPNLVVAAP